MKPKRFHIIYPEDKDVDVAVSDVKENLNRELEFSILEIGVYQMRPYITFELTNIPNDSKNDGGFFTLFDKTSDIIELDSDEKLLSEEHPEKTVIKNENPIE